MKGFENWAENHLVPIADKMNRIKIIAALRDGMVVSLPFMLFGAFCMIIANFPYLDKLSPQLVVWLQNFFNHAATISMGLLAISILVGVASSYAREQGVDRIYGTLVAFLSYLSLSIFKATGDVTVKGKVIHNAVMDNVIPENVFTSESIFTVIIVSLISIKLYSIFINKHWTIRMPDSVPPNVSASFTALIPVVLVLFIFIVARNLLLLTPWGSFQAMIYTFVTTPLLKLGNNVFALMFIETIQQVLWFIGIHGTNVVSAIITPIYNTTMAANLDAFNAGKALPYILTTPWLTTYGQAGAQGILPAVIAALIVGKSKQTKTISRMSLPVATFNIQETFHFGFPTFMNPILLFPYVFCTIIQMVIAYVLCVVHIAPVPIYMLPWTTPVLISGFLASGSIMGTVTQLIELIVGILLWIPFIKVVDNRYHKSEMEQAAEDQDKLEHETAIEGSR